MAHVAEYKKKEVKELIEQIKNAKIVGIVNMENIPAPQLQKMRAQLRDSVDMRMSKKTFLRRAIDEVKEKEGLADLKEKLKGMPALLTTDTNPFALYKTLKKRKSNAPIKAGQIAPNDIVVKAGKTNFAPGPIISELGGFGIKTKIDAGKIEITEDAVVAKEGEEVTPELASLLTRLDIKPMEIGLDLVAVFEDGVIYDKSVLDIDEDEFMAKITTAHQEAFNVAVEANVMNTQTVEYFITKASSEAFNLAMDTDILTEETVEQILAKANAQATSLKNSANL
jgi:large subunit ribosomal protein L10